MQNEFKGLRHYIDIVEGKQQVEEDANTAGNVTGQVARTAVNTATAPIRGAVAGANWLADKAGQAWDATKQGVQNFAQGVQQGFTQGGVDPLAPIDSSKQAVASYNQSGNQAAKTPTTPEEIKAFQKANGLTADGIIGPKTLAVMKQKGMQAPAAKPAAKPAQGQGAKASATPAAPAAAPTTQSFDDGSKLTTTATGQTAATDSAGNPYVAGTNNATANTTGAPNMGQVNQAGGYDPKAAQTPTKENPLAGATPEQIKALGGANPLDPIIRNRMGLAPIPGLAEGTGYREDQTIARIVDLANYRR